MLRRLLADLGARYGYTPRQSRQILGLLVLALGLTVLPLFYKAWLLQQPLAPVPLPTLTAVQDTVFEGDRYSRSASIDHPNAPHKRFYFDPNTLPEQGWVDLGLPRWLAQRILKYRAKGGRFRSGEDVGRIYDFPPELLAELLPYMQVAGNAKQPKTRAQTSIYPEDTKADPYAAPSYPTVNLNTADSTELEELPQIGPATARNIVKYRKLLGGYVSKNQLYELYNQDSARTAVFLPYLKLYPGEGKTPLDINALARKGGIYHPYIPKTNARLIAAWVRQHGNLARGEQLLENKLLDSAHYKQVLPYLAF